MNMNDGLEKYYKVLNLSREANSQDIKRAYRELAKKWHPDSLGPNASHKDRELAEQKFNEITKAYRTLINHVRIREIIRSRQKEKSSSDDFVQASTSSSKNVTGKVDVTNKKWLWLGIVSLVILTILSLRTITGRNKIMRYIIVKKTGSRSISTEPKRNEVKEKGQVVQKTNRGDRKREFWRRSFFTLYSTKEEVLNVQGPPDKVSGKKWYYGLSSVTFENGRVVGYDNFDGKLKIRIVPRRLPGEVPLYFTLGSSQDEVLLVQGMPSRVVRSTWYYGLDRVFFENGRVVGYDDFTGSLRVKLVPRNFPRQLSNSFFSIGSTQDEVLAVQGTPTKVIGNRWYYGLSEVIFKQGKVIRVNNVIHNLKFRPLQKNKKKKLSLLQRKLGFSRTGRRF